MPSASTRTGPSATHMCATPPRGPSAEHDLAHRAVERSSRPFASDRGNDVLRGGRASRPRPRHGQRGMDHGCDERFGLPETGPWSSRSVRVPDPCGWRGQGGSRVLHPGAVSPDAALLEVMAQIGRHLGRVVERIHAQEQIAHQATHDALTGLANRLLFRDRLELALARAKRHGSFAALLFLDLDRFKDVNDTLGHSAGDQLLKSVSDRLQRPCERATRSRASATRSSHSRALAATSSSCSARTSPRRTPRCGSPSGSSSAPRAVPTRGHRASRHREHRNRARRRRRS